MSDRTDAGGHGSGGVGTVIAGSFLAVTPQSATPDWSRITQQDVTVKSTLFQDDHTYEGSKKVLTEEDVFKPTAGHVTPQSRFHNLHGRHKEAYINSHPTHNAFSIASTDVSHLRHLAPVSSSVSHHLNQSLTSHTTKTLHTTDTHHIASTFANTGSQPEKNSHTTGVHDEFNSIVDVERQSSRLNSPAITTAMFKKNIYPRNWVSFEDEDNVRSARSRVFEAVSHHSTAALLDSHTAESGQHTRDSSRDGRAPGGFTGAAESGRPTPSSSRDSTDGPAGLQLIINTSPLTPDSKRASAPIFIQGERQRWHNGAYPRSYSETLPSNMYLQGGVTDEDTLFPQHQTSKLARPHSVDITTQVSNKVYDFAVYLPDTSVMAHRRRRQFALSHRNFISSSLPEDSSLKQTVKDSLESKRSYVQHNIFRTNSSASLHSDSPASTAPLVIPPGRPWAAARSWVRLLLDRRGTPAPQPIDDSMDFTQQPALAHTDTVLNVDKKCCKQTNGNAGLESSDKAARTRDVYVERNDQGADTKPETKTAVYKKRWYLLFLFSVSAMLWNAVWSTWGPIAQSAKDVYQWTDGDIAMFIWLGNIPFLLTMFPCSYLMDVKGMRIAMIVACGFMFLGTGCRCIPSDVTTSTWLIRIGQFLNGMAGTIPNSAPALLSALWFPPSQRASATAISTVAGYMGASVSFVIGPLLVPQPNELLPVNNTDDLLSDDVGSLFDTNNTTNVTSYDAQKQGIMHILYAECVVAGLLLLLVLIYFPSKPPLPPSMSAAMPREKYVTGLKMLVRNKQFWVCAIAFSVPAGVYEAWQVILDVILDDKGVDQKMAGWLDFYATVGGCVSGLLVSRFADFFTRQIKLFLLIFYFFAAVSIMWFTLVVFDILPFDKVSMYAAIIIAGVFLDGGGPLFFELTIEVSYPVGEGVTSGFTQMLCAGAGICFLSVVQVESLGKEWINWYFLGCVSLAIPLLFFVSTTYGRADIDEEIDEEDGEDSPSSPDTDEKTYLFGSSHV